MTLIDFAFPKLRSLKTWLDKRLKSNVSEDVSNSNMVNWPKNCWNLHHSTFIILIGNFVINLFIPFQRTLWTANGPRHFWNLHCSTFIILIDNFQGIWVGKNVSYWHDKSWDCLLTHWLPMAIILFLIGTT